MPSDRAGSEWKSSAASPGLILASVAVGAVAGAGIAGLGAVLWLRQREKTAGKGSNGDQKQEQDRVADGAQSSRSLAGTAEAPSTTLAAREEKRRLVDGGSWDGTDLMPPLPGEVVRLLQASRLCFLSTFCDDHPHLTLMNFTYHADDEVIILSTRRDTKKYGLMQTAPHVAILVHEFPSGDNTPNGAATSPKDRGGKVTITLNGSATIQEGALAEKYRELHVKKNPDSKTFIVGPNIAMITVRVRSARICNIRDEVTLWDVDGSARKH